MRSQRVILGLSRTMRRAFSYTSHGQETIRGLPGRQNVCDRLQTQLETIAACIRTGHSPPADPELQPAEAELKQAMKRATSGGDTPGMSPQAFIFALEQSMAAVETLRRDASRIAFDLTSESPSTASASA